MPLPAPVLDHVVIDVRDRYDIEVSSPPRPAWS